MISFFAFVIPISAMVETMICRGGSEWLYLILMWIPTVASIVANCVSFRENGEPFSVKKLLAGGGFRTCRLRYVLLGCLLPLIYLLVPYIVYWLLYPENFAYHGVSLTIILKDILPVLVLLAFASADRRRLYVRHAPVVSDARLCTVYFPGGRDDGIADAREWQRVACGLPPCSAQ